MKLNLDLTKSIPANQITDELHTSVGSGIFTLDHDRFRGSTDLVIRTASGGGGTLLTETTDYTLENEDTALTARAEASVYAGIQVTNPSYQTGNLYISYWTVADLVDAADQYNIVRTTGQYVRLNSDGSMDLASTNGLNISDNASVTLISSAYIQLYSNRTSDVGISIIANQSVSDNAISLYANAGGVDINAALSVLIDTLTVSIDGGEDSNFTVTGGDLTLSTISSGDVILDSAGALTFNDSIQTAARNFSQADADGFATEFGYQSQTDFDWTVRDLGTTAVSSIMGALNANRQDLYEYVELVRTQGAAVGVAAGANLVGADGITSITPTGKTSGDASNLQEMLEGIATYAKAISLDSSYANGSSITVDSANVEWILSTSKSFKIADATDTNKFVVSQGAGASSVKIDTTGGMTIDVDAGFYIKENSGAEISSSTAGSLLIHAGADIIIESPDGDNYITIDDTLISLDAVSSTDAGAITLSAAAGGISISAAGDITIQSSSAEIKIDTDGAVSLKSGTVTDMISVTDSTGSYGLLVNVALYGGVAVGYYDNPASPTNFSALIAGSTGLQFFTTGTGPIAIVSVDDSVTIDANDDSYFHVSGDLDLATTSAGNITISAAGYTSVTGDFRIPTSAPTSPSTGSMYIDGGNNKLYVYYASAWHYTTMT